MDLRGTHRHTISTASWLEPAGSGPQQHLLLASSGKAVKGEIWMPKRGRTTAVFLNQLRLLKQLGNGRMSVSYNMLTCAGMCWIISLGMQITMDIWYIYIFIYHHLQRTSNEAQSQLCDRRHLFRECIARADGWWMLMRYNPQFWIPLRFSYSLQYLMHNTKFLDDVPKFSCCNVRVVLMVYHGIPKFSWMVSPNLVDIPKILVDDIALTMALTPWLPLFQSFGSKDGHLKVNSGSINRWSGSHWHLHSLEM